MSNKSHHINSIYSNPKKKNYFKHKNLKVISKNGRETYLGWREITKRQMHVRRTREKSKEKCIN
jgi:hypothetical protein